MLFQTYRFFFYRSYFCFLPTLLFSFFRDIKPSNLPFTERGKAKIIDGGHTWPGSIFTVGVTNNDFIASKKIWQFFLQYDINGRIQGNSVADLKDEEISIYPNPTTDKLAIQGISQKLTAANCSLFSVEGKQFNIDFLENNTFDTSHLESGVYFVRIATKEGSATVQFVKV